ncbi:MAG: DUF6273 domain-containing protein [Eubacteriales bacterium]|nr:DUF6273 domain-containing protein [Eubacteriales bacterium]
MADTKKQQPKPVYKTREELYDKALSMMERDSFIVKEGFRAENYRNAANIFRMLGDYQDSKELEAKCLKIAEDADQKELEYQYELAESLRDSANSEKGYDKAVRQFESLGDYKDAAAQKQTCEEQRTIYGKRNARRKTVTLSILVLLVIGMIWFFNSSTWNKLWLYITTGSTTGNADSQNSAKDDHPGIDGSYEEGDVITFGNYNWYVLNKEDGRVRLLMNHAEKHEELRHRPYNDTDEDVTWETSSLREWLNGDFLTEGFQDEERSRILTLTTTALDNETYDTDGGNNTEDQVTILTPDDITTYSEIIDGISMNLWLLAPGNASNTAQFMSSRRTIMDYGYPVDTTDFYTCPVIWVQTEDADASLQ